MKFIRNRNVDTSSDTTQKDHSILSGFQSIEKFDDQIDLDAELKEKEALGILLRGLRLVRYAKGLFAAKWVLSAALIIPGMFLGWFGKIVADHVILGIPLVVGEVNFPPHMMPLLRMMEGLERMEIMGLIVVITLVGLFVIGTRVGGTGAIQFSGRDTASNAENQISSGGSSASGIWGLVEFWVDVRLTQRVVNGLRRSLFVRLIRSRMSTVDDQRIGDRIFRVLYDTPMVYTCITELTFSPFFLLVNLGLAFYQLQWTYGHLAEFSHILLCAVMFPVTFFAAIPFSKHIRRVSQNQRAAGSATTNAMEEAMDNITAVQSLGGMEQEKQRFAKKSAHAYWRERLNLVVWVGIGVAIEIAQWPIGFYMAWLVTNLVIEGKMTVGDFFALFYMYMAIRGHFSNIGRLWVNLQDQAAAARRVFFFLDYEVDGDRHDGKPDLPSVRKKISLDNVSYKYPDGREALRNINLNLDMNQIVALVGPTGSGKTSLAYLIPGFLRPTEGEVRFDRQNIDEFNIESLRSQVSYVYQEHMLLSESIRSNLLLANPQATEEEMIDALTTAGCMEFIEELPDGIDHVLGKSGDNLSVGQQQRLSIARGLVRDTRVLILDEPTAALDPQTENELIRKLRNLSDDRIVIVIAHRLSTIRRADSIVFMDEGEIKDIGDHETLMQKEDGPYRRFVALQGG